MAKPPELLAEMLPKAALVVIGTVKRIVQTGAPLPPLPQREEHNSDIGARSPEQTLELELESVLKGKPPGAQPAAGESPTFTRAANASLGGKPPGAQPAAGESPTFTRAANASLGGKHEGLLTVKKPIAGYSVREGTKGAWLIDESGTVLGRYGPDSWRAKHVQAALE